MICLFSLLLMTGCASIVRSGFAGDQTYADIKAAKTGSEPIGKIAYGAAKNIKISDNSPSLDSPTTKGRYEIVSVSGKKGRAFNLTIEGICNCLGHRKWLVIPITYMLDDAWEVVATGVPTSDAVQELTGVFPENKDYHAMVVVDATSKGKKVGTIRMERCLFPASPPALPSVCWPSQVYSIPL